MKEILVTSLIRDEKKVKSLLALLQPYHLTMNGHFWVDDLAKMAWANVKDELFTPKTWLWIIVADQLSLKSASILKGLSGLSLLLQADEHAQPNLLILLEDGVVIPEELPFPLQHAQILPLSQPGLGAKIVGLLHKPLTRSMADYRIKLHPLYELGLWIEVGPKHPDSWSGVMFGVNGAEINLQGYGDLGIVPEHCTIEYPQEGIKIQVGDDEFSAWAIRNVIDGTTSYFARVDQFPNQILFCPYANDDEAEAYIFKLC